MLPVIALKCVPALFNNKPRTCLLVSMKTSEILLWITQSEICDVYKKSRRMSFLDSEVTGDLTGLNMTA